MSRTARLVLLVIALISLIQFTFAASATSFCKCTCFTNSTIIQLDGDAATSPAKGAGHRDAKTRHGTCLDCNKKFCLDYNLPICKDANGKAATEAEVFTTCFQRDSTKDQAVVFIFIFATVGLLVYAAIRPCVERWAESIRERRSYVPISNAGAEES